MPGWMSAVDGFGAPQAFGLGLALSALNPKNFGLTVAAVASISSAGLNPGQEVTALLVFVLIASAGVLAPSVAYLVARDRVEAGLDSARIWLVANSGTVMTVIFLVLGAVVFGDGISGLT
jgi:threonine/homoserine/homoserine lactone efflux protein